MDGSRPPSTPGGPVPPLNTGGGRGAKGIQGEVASALSCCHQLVLKEVTTMFVYLCMEGRAIHKKTQIQTPTSKQTTTATTPQNQQGQTLLLPPCWALASLTTSPEGAAMLSGRFFHPYSGPLLVRL